MVRIGVGDPEALGLLMGRYWALLARFAEGYVLDPDDAEDVVLEAFASVWRHRTSWVLTGTVSAYLYRITRNLALNSRRDRLAHSRRVETMLAEFFRGATSFTPEDHFAEQRLREELAKAFEALSERKREIFHLSRCHGMSHQEVAAALGISPQTVSNQIAAVLEALRKVVRKHQAG